MGTFSISLRRYADLANARAEEVVKTAIADVATSLITRSPVGDPLLWRMAPPPGYVGGQFRANWQVALDAPAEGVVLAVDPTGQATIAAAAKDLQDLTMGQTVFISNNLPYAQRLEDGWSTQAPAGMVALTVLEFQDIVNKAVSKLPPG